MAGANRTKPRRGARAAAALSSGVLLALAQPNWGAWPLGFVCLVPLLLALRGADPWARATLGWLASLSATLLGCVAHAGVAATAYFDLASWQGWLASLGAAQLFGGVPLAAFAIVAPRADGEGPASHLRTAAAWSAMEALRCALAGGLPWLLLAYALAPEPEWIGPARWGGVLLVSAWMAGVNAALASAVAAPGRRLSGLAAAGIALVLLRLAGPGPDGAGGSTTRVRVVHTDVSGHAAPARLAELSRTQEAPLVVWPENAVGGVVPANVASLRALRAEAAPGAELLLGATHARGDTRPAFFTSAVLIPRDGAERVYDKRIRVPFFEYTPWPFGVPHDAVEISVGASPLTLDAADISVAPLICYEMLFPEHARRGVLAGARALVHLSNEAWFGWTRGADQLLAAAVFRAVETGRPVLRATNAGVSGLVLPSGRMPVRHRGEATALDVRLPEPSRDPLALRVGTSWWWLAAAVAIAGFVRDRRRAT